MFKGRRFVLFGLMAVLVMATAACATATDDGDSTDTTTGAIAGACLEGTVDCNDTPGELPGEGLPPNASDDEPTDGPSVDLPVVPIEDVAEYEGAGPVTFSGFYISDANGAQLCELIAESYPPQCGGASLTISNPEAMNVLALVEEGEVQWYDNLVRVTGEVTDGELFVEVAVD